MSKAQDNKDAADWAFEAPFSVEERLAAIEVAVSELAKFVVSQGAQKCDVNRDPGKIAHLLDNEYRQDEGAFDRAKRLRVMARARGLLEGKF